MARAAAARGWPQRCLPVSGPLRCPRQAARATAPSAPSRAARSGRCAVQPDVSRPLRQGVASWLPLTHPAPSSSASNPVPKRRARESARISLARWLTRPPRDEVSSHLNSNETRRKTLIRYPFGTHVVPVRAPTGTFWIVYAGVFEDQSDHYLASIPKQLGRLARFYPLRHC